MNTCIRENHDGCCVEGGYTCVVHVCMSICFILTLSQLPNIKKNDK